MNSNGNWVLQIDESVHKFLSRIPRKDAQRIISVVSSLPESPFFGDIQKMKGEENVWRRRTGSYRIRYELIPKERVVHVFLIERRTSSAYK
ncbi:MAG TPA: type II toxin-antitoxin system RelE/ParE family toxin [Candidatus Paceibacterota bacterium]